MQSFDSTIVAELLLSQIGQEESQIGFAINRSLHRQLNTCFYQRINGGNGLNLPECKTVFQGIVEQNCIRTKRSRVPLQLQPIVLLCSNVSGIYESFHKAELRGET